MLADLLAQLQRGIQQLREAAPGLRNGEYEAEWSGYRTNLAQLNQILPSIQECLLREKARLEGVRSHLAAAAAWVEMRKTTL